MPRILVVEDDPSVGASLARVLAYDASVDLVRDAAAALQRLRDGVYDVLLTDVDLGPGPDGLWLLREVARCWPGLRRIAMSAIDRPTREVLLAKPLSLPDLEWVIRGDIASRTEETFRGDTASTP